MSLQKVCKSWSRSSYETIAISHIWTIDGFSLRKEIVMQSSPFSMQENGKERKEWRMVLYPHGLRKEEDYKGHLSLYLNLMNPTEEEIEVSRLFSMHDEKGKCLSQIVAKINRTYSKTSPSWGFVKFIKRDELLNKLLPNDILKITCHLSYINVLKNVSGTIEESSLQQDEEPVPCNLIENLGAMLNNNDFSDVTLSILGEGEEKTEFKAHKAFLAARSPYFGAMFTHDFKEKAENRVEINDVTPVVFKEILTYIYTGKVEPQNMNENGAKELFVAADRFALDGLKMAVKNLLISKINVENASELLVLGHIHSAENLKTIATDFVASNLRLVTETDGLKNMIREHPHLMEPILMAASKKIN